MIQNDYSHALLNKNVLNLDLKHSKLSSPFISLGNLFQGVGEAAQKALSSSVFLVLWKKSLQKDYMYSHEINCP